MRNITLYTIILYFIVLMKGYAQPSWYPGTLLFNLTENKYPFKPLTIDDIKNKEIRFLSNDKESKIIYDTVNNSFSFTSGIGYELKVFAIVQQRDTVFIEFPAVENCKVFVKSPIPLSTMSFSFYDNKVFDAMIANYKYNKIDTFYLSGGFIFNTIYEMQDKRKVNFLLNLHWYDIELKE